MVHLVPSVYNSWECTGVQWPLLFECCQSAHIEFSSCSSFQLFVSDFRGPTFLMKIICVGFPKTGTKSMAAALRQLGFAVNDFPEHLYGGFFYLKINSYFLTWYTSARRLDSDSLAHIRTAWMISKFAFAFCKSQRLGINLDLFSIGLSTYLAFLEGKVPMEALVPLYTDVDAVTDQPTCRVVKCHRCVR